MKQQSHTDAIGEEMETAEFEELALELLFHMSIQCETGPFSEHFVPELPFCDVEPEFLLGYLLRKSYIKNENGLIEILHEGRVALDQLSPEWKMRHMPLECHDRQK